MPDKYQLASYLASIITIIESKQDAARPPGTRLTTEYEKVYEEFMEAITEKETDDVGSRRT